jgi:hypothetical protein
METIPYPKRPFQLVLHGANSQKASIIDTSRESIPEDSVLRTLILDIPHNLQNIVSRKFVRFEVFTAMTMKNDVFWVVTPCGSSHGVTTQKTPFFTVRNLFKIYL